MLLANSLIGAPPKGFRDVVTNIYLDNIAPEFPIGYWVARHGLTSEQYQEAFNDYVGNHGMQLIDVSGYGTAYGWSQKFPGLEYVHLSNSMGTPQAAMLEQLAWLGKEVLPHFTVR